MKEIPRVDITKDMQNRAKIESKRRDSFIKHHFEVEHLSYEKRDELGFLGEFACCKYFGKDWRQNIRDNYHTIDDYDFIINGKRIDVKTETVPVKYAKKILRGTISDDELYGRRLINQGQFKLLEKYDLVIFSLFARDKYQHWFPIGYLETETILQCYPPTKKRPDGGEYPFSGSPIPTSILKPVKDLLEYDR